MNIADSLREITVAGLDLSRYVTVAPGAAVAEVIGEMNADARSCAFVVEQGSLVGVFTQRDVITDVIGMEGACESAVEEFMSPTPRSISGDTPVADALAVMTELWVRSLPVVDEGRVVGNFSYYTAMKVIAELLADKASRAEPELSAQHGLMFVDFTGLRTDQAVTVGSDDSVDTVLQQMRARALGSVLVVNDRESLVGVLTEFDLQTKVACTGADPARLTVGEVMEPHPVALDARAPIADAVAGMARHEISHVALLADTGKPVGMATFQEVANYFDSSLEALG